MSRDHRSLVLVDHRGLFSRGTQDTIPTGHYRDCLNVDFSYGEVHKRPGFALDFTVNGVEYASMFAPALSPPTGVMAPSVSVDPREIYLTYDGVDGKVRDRDHGIILTIAGMSGCAMLMMFGRMYLSPYDKDTGMGLAGEKVYVYKGDGTTPVAIAGPQPSTVGFPVPASSGAGTGKISAGWHLIYYAFETASGFITRPNESNTSILAAEGDKITLTGIPLGPAGTVARHIMISKTLGPTLAPGSLAWDFEIFFAPLSKIPDNTTTTGEIDVYDADLVDSADYLKDNLSEVPAGSFLVDYGGKLVVGGEAANPAIIRIATNAGQPEAFSEVDGFVLINPGDSGGGVTNAFPHKGLLYVTKMNRIYVTTDDGSAPAEWPVSLLDSSIGASPLGVSVVMGSPAAVTEETILLAASKGIVRFNGTLDQRDLTWKVEEIWKRINQTYLNSVQIVIDSSAKRIYCNIPLDSATSPSHILMGDYSEGLDSERIKWALWQTFRTPKTIWIKVDATGKATFKHAGVNIHKMDATLKDDHTVAIDSYISLPYLPENINGGINHYGGAHFRISGNGNMTVSLSSVDETEIESQTAFAISSTPGKDHRLLFNYQSEQMSLKIRNAVLGTYWSLRRIILFIKPLWLDRVQE